MTKADESSNRSADRPAHVASELSTYGERGVWAPSGLTAEEIMVGTEVLERRFSIEHYEARSMVRAVLTALRNRQPAAPTGSDQSPPTE